jgi:hypothetical protein
MVQTKAGCRPAFRRCLARIPTRHQVFCGFLRTSGTCRVRSQRSSALPLTIAYSLFINPAVPYSARLRNIQTNTQYRYMSTWYTEYHPTAYSEVNGSARLAARNCSLMRIVQSAPPQISNKHIKMLIPTIIPIVKPTRCTSFSNYLFSRNTLHVSDGLSVHHQELLAC